MTMTQMMLMVIGILLIVLAAAAIAMLKAMHDITLCLYAMDESMISAADMEELLTMPRPPNGPDPQARADDYSSPLVRRAAEKLNQRRNEATNG